MTDGEDCERLRRRDTEAWDRLYRACATRTYRVLYHITKADRRDLEELNQAVWLGAIQTIDHLDASRGTARDWVLGIARHKALSFLRQKYRRRMVSFGADPDSTAADPKSKGNPDMQEQAVILRACIESLPENWQFVLRQKYEVGLSMKEIADLCGSTVKAVESILSRARYRLRDLVRDTWDSPRTENSQNLGNSPDLGKKGDA